ncbi:MAG: MerR family transcriptional regulator [Albidovulum sp.]
MSDETLTIREMCEAFEVTPRALRFYEAKELLFPRRLGQKRLYTRRDRTRLKLILRGKRFGFSLEQIRQLLDMYDIEETRGSQLVEVYDAARERLAELKRQRDELDQTIDELSDQIGLIESHIASQSQSAA